MRTAVLIQIFVIYFKISSYSNLTQKETAIMKISSYESYLKDKEKEDTV